MVKLKVADSTVIRDFNIDSSSILEDKILGDEGYGLLKPIDQTKIS
jgi:hypothetical protein